MPTQYQLYAPIALLYFIISLYYAYRFPYFVNSTLRLSHPTNSARSVRIFQSKRPRKPRETNTKTISDRHEAYPRRENIEKKNEKGNKVPSRKEWYRFPSTKHVLIVSRIYEAIGRRGWSIVPSTRESNRSRFSRSRNPIHPPRARVCRRWIKRGKRGGRKREREKKKKEEEGEKKRKERRVKGSVEGAAWFSGRQRSREPCPGP